MLIDLEGIDGSGKSTQIALLRQWLISEGYTVFFSEWNSSPLVKQTTSKGKKKQLLTPTTFSLIHATDFADRTEHDIIPPLKAGAIVLADRYIYTAFARDVARNVAPRATFSTRDRQWPARSLRAAGFKITTVSCSNDLLTIDLLHE